MPGGATPLVHLVKQDYRCEQQMKNRSFPLSLELSSNFPMLLLLNCLPVIFFFTHLPFLISPPLSSSPHLSFIFFFLPVQTGCISVSSHMLLAESQLSLLSQSDGPGHTSGSPWQGSPPAQPASPPVTPTRFMEPTGSRSFVGFNAS